MPSARSRPPKRQTIRGLYFAIEERPDTQETAKGAETTDLKISDQ